MENGRVLVAGATGRVGGAAVEHLLDSGYAVRALVRRSAKGEYLRSLGVEVSVGDVTRPGTVMPAVEGCSAVLSALAAGPGRGDAATVEYEGNLNLLQAARSAGVGRFVYSSALMADHPLAERVGEFREKARFEKELEAAGVSYTILCPAMFYETLLLALRGPVAFVPGRLRLAVAWISASDVALAAVRALQRDVEGRHELAGPDRCTFDEAYLSLSRATNSRITVLHPPLAALRLPGRLLPYVRDLANMFALFDAAGYATDSVALRETFGITAANLEEWAGQVFPSGRLG